MAATDVGFPWTDKSVDGEASNLCTAHCVQKLGSCVPDSTTIPEIQTTIEVFFSETQKHFQSLHFVPIPISSEKWVRSEVGVSGASESFQPQDEGASSCTNSQFKAI